VGAVVSSRRCRREVCDAWVVKVSAKMLIVHAAILVSRRQSSRELNHLPLKLLIIALQFGLLRALSDALKVGCNHTVQLVFDASVAALPRILDDIALQLWV
jgi:hypothetical protein